MPSSRRISARRSGVESHSVGLEDELSFGSEEDLMETIGEIQVPEEPLDSRSIASASSSASKPKLPKLSKSTRSFVRSRKESSASTSSSKTSLASTTHLLPPLPPVPSGSTLDLPADMFTERERPSSSKRGSIMGAFKSKGMGLRSKWRDDHSNRSSFVTDTHSMGSTLSLSKIGSNVSSRPSVSSSFAHTPHGGPSPNSTVPHLGPLSFDQSSDPSFHSGQKQPPAGSHIVLHPSLRNLENAPASGSPTSSIGGHKSWGQGDVASAILPPFPATIGSLEPITVFSAEASKRTSSASRSPFPNRWSPCTLVFTQFKVSLNSEDSPGSDTERTVAHIHVYSKSAQAVSGMASMASVGSAVRRTRSNAGINGESAGRVEIERRWLSRSTTAALCDDEPDADGRSVVMRILWGDEDGATSTQWLVEMKDTRQLQEWIRQIKKTAIMINAEELGYGSAIRPAFETKGVSADELAHQLSLHARAVAEGGAGGKAGGALPSPSAASTGAGSEEERRRPSLDAIQGAPLARSHSASEANAPNGSLGRAHLNTGSEEKMPAAAPAAEVDWFNGPRANGSSTGTATPNDLGGLFGGMNLGMAFPTPPSDLPPPMRRKPPSPLNTIPARVATPPVTHVSAYDEDEDVAPAAAPRPPTPPLKKEEVLTAHLRKPASVASETPSQTSTTSRLRRLRGKPQVIDIMAEFSAVEAENMPEDEEEPIREDRERRIRFAEE
ncbi:hypothetical protein CC85DRAFT_288322 [Cutaneotrichosporon oleaginosum]|uniref:Uncharacterized protein n=1 Tax=Cutaneotrichosporon oleaginosum TaxID=879819 RepID=A0A0J0XF32_9TREE|nr:uncharacterized protein CC85DRAFT_288322 [Cutaneotrichosporon oleaginosum]KLT39680.1 hypothetical protein CC85DRAFT_288322 [Cutaneotrichosporon oleaginosum]TXT07013.1 hypothetical protein COLE_06344 [Cutaneotrichosporon oleaginosum]